MSMHPQTRAACKISLYRKHRKLNTKKRRVDKGELQQSNTLMCVGKGTAQKKQKATATLENVLDVSWILNMASR